MEVGRFGKKLPELLWMLIIISTIGWQIISAGNIVILHQEMDLLQILWLWHMIRRETHI
jgi:hypothetical protein